MSFLDLSIPGCRVSNKIKRAHCRTNYYSNHCASFQTILSGDIELNPGPGLRQCRCKLKPSKPKVLKKSPPCSVCTISVGSNRKRLLCTTCLNLTHLSCSTLPKTLQEQIRAAAPYKCAQCILQTLPFLNSTVDLSQEPDAASVTNCDEQQCISTDKFHSIINKQQHLLKISHLNTQSMLSTFDEFECLIHQYPFDVITLSETWLKDNQHVLDYVRISGYSIEYRNRKDRSGGGVGIYLRDNINSKVRSDIINLEPDFEHIWIEIEGKNKHSHVLIGNFYQPNFNKTDQLNWLDKFEAMLTKITSAWSGILVLIGDMNINLFDTDSPVTQKYVDILAAHNLHQHIDKATRNSCSLIDHISTNYPNKVKHTDVIPCPEVSDHDMPFICLNARLNNFGPRYKFIRLNSKFSLKDYTNDFNLLPFNAVYSVENVDDKLHILNTQILDCLNSHAPLKRCKITRPPAPWLKSFDFSNLNVMRNVIKHIKQIQLMTGTTML